MEGTEEMSDEDIMLLAMGAICILIILHLVGSIVLATVPTYPIIINGG